jgi:hypothetical protein
VNNRKLLLIVKLKKINSELILKLTGNYQREGTNYDGEKENQDSISIQGSIKF